MERRGAYPLHPVVLQLSVRDVSVCSLNAVWPLYWIAQSQFEGNLRRYRRRVLRGQAPSGCRVRWHEGRVEPLPLREFEPRPPMGGGNQLALSDTEVRRFAKATLRYIRAVEGTFKVSIPRITIDAPSCYKKA